MPRRAAADLAAVRFAEQVEPIQIHHLVPRGDEVVHEPLLTVGRRVRITAGPFAGLEGILKRKKSSLRVVVSLELIQRSVAVDVDAADVAPTF